MRKNWYKIRTCFSAPRKSPFRDALEGIVSCSWSCAFVRRTEKRTTPLPRPDLSLSLCHIPIFLDGRAYIDYIGCVDTKEHTSLSLSLSLSLSRLLHLNALTLKLSLSHSQFRFPISSVERRTIDTYLPTYIHIHSSSFPLYLTLPMRHKLSRSWHLPNGIGHPPMLGRIGT